MQEVIDFLFRASFFVEHQKSLTDAHFGSVETRSEILVVISVHLQQFFYKLCFFSTIASSNFVLQDAFAISKGSIVKGRALSIYFFPNRIRFFIVFRFSILAKYRKFLSELRSVTVLSFGLSCKEKTCNHCG